MRRLLLIAAFVVLWTGVAIAQERPQLSVPKIVEKVKKGVIRIEILNIGETAASGGYGGGSGFVFEVDYDKGEAYAITNHHVAGKAAVVQVTFWDGATYRGELVAHEPGIDVALLRIVGIPDERDLPDSQKTIVPCVLGDSDQVQIGETGVAMGNPGADQAIGTKRGDPLTTLLLDQNVTSNVVTGRDTPLEFEIGIWKQNRGESPSPEEGWLGWQYGTNMDYAFRMSTAINPGNSGGPLFNARGEVIAINFYGGGFILMQNSNHAIPINLAKDFVFQILQTGKFEKPWLGLDIIMPPFIQDAGAYAEFLDRNRTKDMVVFDVRKDSPAARAGIRKDDIILEVDGQKFKTPEEVRLYVFNLEIGAKVSIIVSRNGKKEKPIEVEVSPKRVYNAEFSV
jgi:serine protease Do